jgi:DNA-binding protein HU-beta
VRSGAFVKKKILMGKSDLVKALHDRNASLTREEIAEVINGALALIVETVAKGGEVGLHGFGKFRSVDLLPRTLRTPKTGMSGRIVDRALPRFTAGKSFREALAANSPAFAAPE